jgi:hypothetical protein
MDIFEMYSFFLYGVVAVYLFMSFMSIKYSDGPLSSVFSLICLASAVFVLGAAFQFNSQTLDEILFFQKLKYLGAPFVPGLWVIFAHRVYFRRKMSLSLTLVILLIPALIIFLVATNEYHRLYYAGIDVFQVGEYLFSRRKTGPLYLLNVAYGYAAAGFCLFSFFPCGSRAAFG